MLTTRVPRSSWSSATVVVAVLGSLVLSVSMGLGLAVGYGRGTGEWDQVALQVGGQLSYLPGVLIVAAGTVAIIGVWPRWSLLAWGGVAFVIFQVMLGETLRLPGWIESLSPFWHLPELPVRAFDPAPAVTELVLAAALVALGLWGFRRRDVGVG